MTLDNGLKGLGLSLGWVNLLCSLPWASYFTRVCMMVQEYVVKFDEILSGYPARDWYPIWGKKQYW